MLSKELKLAVQKELRKGCWKEAKKILELTDDKDREEFMKYHLEDKGNICCIILDYAKKKLVDSGKMAQKDSDQFKSPFWFGVDDVEDDN